MLTGGTLCRQQRSTRGMLLMTMMFQLKEKERQRHDSALTKPLKNKCIRSSVLAKIIRVILDV